MRLHLFEFEDFPWFPNAIRQGGTDYLCHFLKATHFYDPVVPLLIDTLEKTGEESLLDLCSGGGGPMEQLSKGLTTASGKKIRITLSDKFPNTDAFRLIQTRSGGLVGFSEASVDATAVPPDMKGCRTMFSAIHHFQPGTIKAILKDAVEQKAGIALFDGGDKSIFTILGIILFHPIAFLLCTPFFKPFRFSRLFLTYLLPLIPITTVWDGAVSILRLYQPEELLALAQGLEAKDYEWRSGKVKNKLGFRVTYLIGYPKHSIQQAA